MAEKRDIFNRVVDLGKPLAADATRVIIKDVGEADFLAQSLNISYQQNINRLWELGSLKTFFFAGRTEGNINIKRVLGHKNAQLKFVKQYGDVCNMENNVISLKFEAGCTNPQALGTVKASGCVIKSVAYSVQAQDMIINEDMTLMFARLEA